jgi:superkiller protein 3
MLRSRAHEARRNLAAAIADVEGALALSPRDARGYNELGILCADAKESDRAIEAFSRATVLDPRYARAWNNLGSALREVGRVDDARSAFTHATKADPGYPLGWANLGVANRDLGLDAEASVAFDRALALDPRQRLALDARTATSTRPRRCTGERSTSMLATPTPGCSTRGRWPSATNLAPPPWPMPKPNSAITRSCARPSVVIFACR